MTLVRNHDWWGDQAILDRIIFRVIALDAQIDALANGEIDFIDIGPDVNKLQRAKGTEGRDPRVPVARTSGTSRSTAPRRCCPDVAVRRALAKAIDRRPSPTP